MSTTVLREPIAPTWQLVVAGNIVLLGLIALGLTPVALLLAVALPAAAAIALRPQRGLLLLALLAPFHGLLLILPLPSFATGWKEGLTLATLLATFVAPLDARGDPGRRLPAWVAGAAGLGFVALATATTVGMIQAAVGMKVGFFYVLVAWAAWRCPLSRRERDLLVSIIMATGVVTAAVGVAQQIIGATRLHELGYEYDTTIRYTGSFLRSFSTFNQPFGFGFYVALAVLIGIPQVLTDPSRWRNRMFLLATPLLGLGLVSSFVRGSWLALGVGLLYLGSRRYRVLLLIIPVALVAMAFLPADISASAFSSHSSKQRTESWLSHANLVVEHPFGSGVGSTGSAAEKVAILTKASSFYQPDNYYFKTVVELGVIGLWFLLLLLVSSFTSVRAVAARLSGADAALAESVAAMVLGAAAAAIVATYFEIFPMDLLFWLLIAVVATCDRR